MLSNAKLEVRREALNFFIILVQSLKGHPKDLVLEKLDLIQGALYLLNHDYSLPAIVEILSLIESCLYYEADNLPKKLKIWEKDGEEIGVNPDWVLQLAVRWITNFFACDGENILIGLRERNPHNQLIYETVTNFELRYFTLDLD